MNNNKNKNKQNKPEYDRAFYNDRFYNGLMRDPLFLSTLKPGERFIQMNEQYAPFYFLSTEGYVISMYGTTESKLAWRKLSLDDHTTSKKSRRPAMRLSLAPTYKAKKMLYIQLEHFKPDEYQKITEKGYHGHHRTAVACYGNLENQDVLAEINRLENCQAAPPDLHDAAKAYQFRNMNSYFEKIEQREDSTDEIITGDLTSFFASRLTGTRGFTIFDNKIGNCLTFFEDANPQEPDLPDEAAEE